MEIKTAIEILEYHQKWRLGKREDMIHEPKKLTQALDIVLSEVKKLPIHIVVDSACLCVRNGRGEQISGWCREHHTDWM